MTDEPPALVDKWVSKVKPTYPVVSLKTGEFERFLGVRFFPTAAVIAPDGKLAYTGSAGAVSGPLGDAMRGARKGSMYPKVLAKATKYLRADELDKSYGELLKVIEGGKVSEGDRPMVELFRSYLEGVAQTALEEGTKLEETGRIHAAVGRVERFARAKSAFPASESCRALLSQLEALPNFKKEMKGGERFLEGQEEEEAGEFLDAFKTYKAVMKKYAGTRIAEVARGEAQRLLQDGKPGYQGHCMSCKKGRRACDKHRAKVTL